MGFEQGVQPGCTRPFLEGYPQAATQSLDELQEDTSRNYVVVVTANENDGSTQHTSVVVFFEAPAVNVRAIPGVSFLIPSQPVQFSYSALD